MTMNRKIDPKLRKDLEAIKMHPYMGVGKKSNLLRKRKSSENNQSNSSGGMKRSATADQIMSSLASIDFEPQQEDSRHLSRLRNQQIEETPREAMKVETVDTLKKEKPISSQDTPRS